MDIDNIIDRAQQVVDSCKDSAPILMGLPVNVDTSWDPTMSPPTDNFCGNCGDPVKSTVIKDAVLDMTKDKGEYKAVLLCMKCMVKLMKMRKEKNPEEVEIRTVKL